MMLPVLAGSNTDTWLRDLPQGCGVFSALFDLTQFKGLFVGRLFNVPATCEWISGTDLLRPFYVLPH